MFLARDQSKTTIKQIRVIYIVVLKLEAAAAAQSVGNGQLMVLKVGKFE